MTSSPATVVVDVPELDRYEIRVDGRTAGIAAYVRQGDRYVFTHTVIEGEWEGQGLGGILARTAVLSVTEAGGTVVPRCPFIAGYLEKHPELEVRAEWPES